MMVHKGGMHGHCIRMWPDEVRDNSVCADTTAIDIVSRALSDELDGLEPKDRRFAAEWVDLNDDGQDELVVMLLSSYFCGSGGCTWYIFHGDGSVLTRGTVAGYPFYVGEPGVDDYRTLYIRSGGAYHTMEFSEGSYPTNPSVEPSIQLFSNPSFTRANVARLLETAGVVSCSF